MALRAGTPLRADRDGPELAFDRAEAGVLLLRITGDWRLKSGLPTPILSKSNWNPTTNYAGSASTPQTWASGTAVCWPS